MSNHSPKRIVSIMREIIRNQCVFSYMPKGAVGFIFNEGLLELTLWPAWLITTTTRGREYMMTAVAGESEE
jgi:hypothetical protein